MIDLNNRHRLHQFLMLELAIRYLKMDLEILTKTKCEKVFIYFTEAFIQKLTKQYIKERQYFHQQQIRLIGWKKIDAYFSEVSVTTAGEDAVFNYANQAVKTNVEELLMDCLNWDGL